MMFSPIKIARHRYVDQYLRIQDKIGGQLGERAAPLTHCVQHLKRGHDAVAGGVLVEADDVPRVLAAQLPALVAQELEHIAVADAGARERDAEPGHRLLEGVIRHQGAGDARKRFFRGAMPGDSVEQLVAVIRTPGSVDDQDAVAVAVQCNSQVGSLIFHLGDQGLGRGGAKSLIDIETVGPDADRDDVGAQLMEHVGRDVVGRAMRAVDDDLHAFQVELGREGRLAELDVAPAGIVDAPRASQAGGLVAAHWPLHLRFDRRLGAVGQLEAVAGEELDAVVGVRIVRRADDYAGREPQRAREVGDPWRRQRAAKQHIDSRGGEACLERGLDHVARDARVLADQHGRMRPLPRQHLARGIAEPQHEVGGHRALAHRAAHAVGAEIIPAHALWYASQTPMTSRVSRTSCTRSIFAPLCSASKAIARLPASRSSTGLPVSLPSVDLRDTPARIGSSESSRRCLRRTRLWSGLLPKPKPGSTTMRSAAMPAPFALSTDSFKKTFTSRRTSS